MAHWILVDYENVRPSDFHPDRQPDTDILVFLGPNQHKIPADLVMALQAFGRHAPHIQCAANGTGSTRDSTGSSTRRHSTAWSPTCVRAG